jgi:hypothetical protein
MRALGNPGRNPGRHPGPRPVLALIGLLLLAGCSSAPSTRGGTGAAEPAALPSSPSPIELNRHLQAVLASKGTGGFTQRTVSKAKDGTVTMVLKGSFSVPAQSWKGSLKYESDSKTFLKATPLKDLAANVIEVGPDSFQNLPSSKGKDAKRWVKSPTPAATAFNGSATLLALLKLTPTSVRKQGSGWELSGHVPARIAMSALGVGEVQWNPGGDADALKGIGNLTVTTTADGTPTGLKINGAAVHLTTDLPPRLRQVLPGQHATLVLRDLGQPVTIKAPAGDQLAKT